MRILATLWFHRFCHREKITPDSLYDVVMEMEAGHIDANLGGGIYKQRLSRLHEGKSGGFRLLVCYRAGERAIFTYGFPKSERENISQSEKEDLKKLADILLNLSETELSRKLQAGAFIEIAPECAPADSKENCDA